MEDLKNLQNGDLCLDKTDEGKNFEIKPLKNKITMKNENVMWKPIEGYETRYEISNDGRVRRADTKKELKPFLNSSGYYQVTLCVNYEKKYVLVSRLVAQAFIPNPENLPFVNHIDENPRNNRVENLEWCTAEYNSNWGTSKFRRNETKKKELVEVDGVIYKTRKEATEKTGLSTYKLKKNGHLYMDNERRNFL